MKEFGFSGNDSIDGWWRGAMGTTWGAYVVLPTIKINKKSMSEIFQDIICDFSSFMFIFILVNLTNKKHR